MTRERVVIDTNVFVSGLLSSTSPPGRAVERAATEDQLVASMATLRELTANAVVSEIRSVCVREASRCVITATGASGGDCRGRAEGASVPGPRRRQVSRSGVGWSGRPHHHRRRRPARPAPVSADRHSQPDRLSRPEPLTRDVLWDQPRRPDRSWFLIGRSRTRIPVAAKIALVTAGATGGIPGSPNPPRCASDLMNSTSMRGASAIWII